MVHLPTRGDVPVRLGPSATQLPDYGPSTMDRNVYTDPMQFELEREKVLGRGWLLAGRSEQVGVNAFIEGSEDDQIPLLQITNEDEARQLKRLDQVRQSRDQGAVDIALRRVESDAADPQINLMPALIDAVGVYATLGEVMGSLGSVFGRHTEVPTI